MHRNVQSNSYGSNETTINNHKDTIKTELETYDLSSYQCNDGQDENGNFTIGLTADFITADDANTFNNWLKNYYSTNSADFDFARIRIHDCYHGEDGNEPCMIGDIWRL
jgi:hypothetical protein